MPQPLRLYSFNTLPGIRQQINSLSYPQTTGFRAGARMPGKPDITRRWSRMRSVFRLAVAALLLMLCSICAHAEEFRGLYVDAFHPGIKTHEQVT